MCYVSRERIVYAVIDEDNNVRMCCDREEAERLREEGERVEKVKIHTSKM